MLLVLPIGPMMSMLSNWYHSVRKKLLRQSTDLRGVELHVEKFGLQDISRLPLPENEAVKLAEGLIETGDFEGAKHVLVDAWMKLPAEQASDMAKIRLREGFVKLYSARGESVKANRISTMPISLLESHVQWIVTHPDEQIGGSSIVLQDESFEPEN